jgi:hypothetical protein
VTDKSKRFVAVGAVLLLGLAGAWGCAHAFFPRDNEEERPPIVVDASEIEFSHGHKWKDHGNRKKWKPEHGDGKTVTGFDVIAIDTSAATVCLADDQPKVEIDYTLTAGGTVKFTVDRELRREVYEPRLTTEETLTYVGNNKRRVKLAKEGLITKVVAGGTACPPFSNGAKVRVIIIPN